MEKVRAQLKALEIDERQDDQLTQTFFDIVDAQIHVFFTLQTNEAIAAMDALGIQAAIIDELWAFTRVRKALPNVDLGGGILRPLSPFAQGAALQHPDRFAVLQRVERLDPDLESVFAVLSSTPGIRAIRLEARDSAERKAIIEGAYDTLLRLAQRHTLPVCVHTHDTAATVRGVVTRFPDVQFILDHCGAPETAEQWLSILQLGKYPNVWLKWSHGHHYFPAGSYPFDELQTELLRACDAFTIQRIMWASDFTHHRSGATWAELLFYLRESPRLSRADKEWLLGRAARVVFNWQAPAVPAVPAHVARQRRGQ